MSSGTQVDLDWAGTDAGQGGAGAPPASAASAGAAGGAYLTDEEILGIEAPAPNSGFGARSRLGEGAPTHQPVIPSEARNPSSIDDAGDPEARRDSSGKDGPRNDKFQASMAGDAKTTQAEACATDAMPSWMAAVAADPKNGAEAQQLWREHQEFRAAFSSPEEARAIKELLPGGVKDVLSLREATQSVDRIDAALFSGDARAQSEVVAELARANPAAFRSMFAEAAKVLAGMGVTFANVPAGAKSAAAGPTLHAGSGQALRENREGWGTRTQQDSVIPNEVRNLSSIGRDDTGDARRDSSGKDGPRNDNTRETAANAPRFDPAAYAAFERSTNDAVARDVRGSISDTLSRVMPEGVADGAARRIGEDIFNEVHRALAADRTLSEQVASVLRDRRFGGAEQQRVASLLAGRAKQLVPSVARRVIGEWTSTVLDTARGKAARQAAAASRIDIAAPGGSLDSMPLRQMSAREVNYASMSDEETFRDVGRLSVAQASQSARKVIYFVIPKSPRRLRNLSLVSIRPEKTRFLGARRASE